MKRFVICMISLTALLFWTGAIRAQNGDPPTGTLPAVFPVVPISVNLERIPQFFQQYLALSSNPWYSSIEAQVDTTRNPKWYQIVLRERASGKQIYYCNSQSTVNTWTGLGREAYYVQIDFSASQSEDSQAVYQFQFKDAAGQPIVWKFVTGPDAPNLWGSSRFMPRPDDFGLALVRGEQNFRAAPGSTVTVGGMSYPASGDSFYATGVLIADIQPVNEEWNLLSAPSQLNPGEKWALHSSDGRDQPLTIQKTSGTSVSVDSGEPNSPNTARVHMELTRAENQYVLNSLTVTAQMHTFHMAFDPALPLPVPMTHDKTAVAFTMDEDNDKNVANGQLVATRGLGDEHLDWTFNSPGWAKAVQLQTGVSVLSGATRNVLKKSSPGVP